MTVTTTERKDVNVNYILLRFACKKTKKLTGENLQALRSVRYIQKRPVYDQDAILRLRWKTCKEISTKKFRKEMSKEEKNLYDEASDKDVYTWELGKIKKEEWGENRDKIRKLIKYGADVNVTDKDKYKPTLLHEAVENGFHEIINILNKKQKYGIDWLSRKSPDGMTPLQMAVSKADKKAVTSLCERIKTIENKNKEILGKKKVEKNRRKQIEGAVKSAVKQLGLVLATSFKKDIKDEDKIAMIWNARDTKNEETALHMAVKKGCLEIVELLFLPFPHLIDMDGRLDLNARNTDGDTPLHIAIKYGHIDIFKLLLSKGADKNVTDKLGYTPFGRLDLNARNKDGDTPLHIAIKYGHIDIFKLLLSEGADKNVTDKLGYTPLYYRSFVLRLRKKICPNNDFPLNQGKSVGSDGGSKTEDIQNDIIAKAQMATNEGSRIAICALENVVQKAVFS